MSALNYAKVLKAQGHEVSMVAEDIGRETAKLYEEAGIRVIYRRLAGRNPLVLYALVRFLHRMASRDEVDVLIPLATYSNHFFASRAANRLGKGFLGIIAGGEFKPPKALMRTMSQEAFICFSHENIESAVRLGADRSRLHLISNRIEAAQDPAWREHFTLKDGQPFTLLTISRLVPSKENSVRYAMKCSEYLHQKGLSVQLRVGGDGPSFEALKKEAEEINRRNQTNLIQMLGLVTKVKEEIQGAHLVFGKGRSVLEPIMMNRLGLVVSEEDQICLCTPETFENLYAFNFAGRGMMQPTTFDQLAQILLEIRDNVYDFKPALAASELAHAHYNVSRLADQFLPVFNQEAKRISKPESSPLRGLGQVLDVVQYMLIYSVSKLKG